MNNIASIKFNIDHYLPKKPGQNIFVLDQKVCQCRELVISSDLDNLIIGQSYTINYSTINNTAIFDPANQTIRAAAKQQRFSTIMYIDPAKTHIVKAEVTGINITASQMCVIKCGELQKCEIPDGSSIVLNSKNNWEYKFNNFLIFKFIPAAGNNSVSLSVATIPEISSPSDLKLASIPLINASADIRLAGEKVGTIIYLTRFDKNNIVLTKNSQNYNGTISPGVFDVV
jgi:hypothetical protein